MAKEEQASSGMTRFRFVSRYIGAFAGIIVGAGAGITDACEKTAKAAGGLFAGSAKVSDESTRQAASPPSIEKAAPKLAEGTKAEAKAEEVKTEPVVAEAKARKAAAAKAEPESSSKGAAPLGQA